MGLFDFLLGGSESTTVQNPATVWGPQANYLQNLYGAAQGLAFNQLGYDGFRRNPFGGGAGPAFPGWGAGYLPANMTASGAPVRQQARPTFNGPVAQTAFPLSQNLLGQGQQLLSGLGQGAGQQLAPFIGPGFTGQQIGALQGVLNRNLTQNVLPGITAQGIGGGVDAALGSRSAIAAGQALGDTQLALSAGTADILGSDVMRRQMAAGQQAGLQGQTALGGIGQLGGLYGLGLAPFQSQFAPIGALVAALGGGQPQVLGGGGTATSSQTGGLANLFSFTKTFN